MTLASVCLHLAKLLILVVLQVACQAPFLDCPVLQLHYQTAVGFAVSQSLQLPLAPHKFMVPEPTILKQAFFDSWKTFTGRFGGHHVAW
jgi:hypothetical protein